MFATWCFYSFTFYKFICINAIPTTWVQLRAGEPSHHASASAATPAVPLRGGTLWKAENLQVTIKVCGRTTVMFSTSIFPENGRPADRRAGGQPAAPQGRPPDRRFYSCCASKQGQKKREKTFNRNKDAFCRTTGRSPPQDWTEPASPRLLCGSFRN